MGAIAPVIPIAAKVLGAITAVATTVNTIGKAVNTGRSVHRLVTGSEEKKATSSLPFRASDQAEADFANGLANYYAFVARRMPGFANRLKTGDATVRREHRDAIKPEV